MMFGKSVPPITALLFRHCFSIACCFLVIVSIGELLFVVEGLATAEEPTDQTTSTNVLNGADINWTRIDPQQVGDVLQMLADQFQANLERIRTWQGEYHVSMQASVSKEYVASWPPGSLGGAPVSALTRHSQFVTRFAVDYPSDSIFQSKETVSMQHFRENSTDEVIVTGVAPVDHNSVVTPEHYVHISPRTNWPNLRELPEHPQAQNKRAAFRESVEETEGQGFSDLMDPRDFFGFTSRTTTYSDHLSLYASSLRGDNGEEAKNKAWDMLELYETKRNDEIIYRLINRRDGTPPNYIVSVWSSAVGYNPTRMVYAREKNGNQPVVDVQTEWKSIDDIFVPNRVTRIAYGEGGKVDYKRTATLGKCVLNQPLDPHQFDYQALGLEDGELVIDKIENVVYVLENGEPVKLANYGDPYVAPLGVRLSEMIPPTYALMIGATIVLIVVLLVLIWRQHATKA